MIISKYTKGLLMVCFCMLGYLAVSSTLFMGLQINALYGNIAIFFAFVFIVFLFRLYRYLVSVEE